MTAVHDAVDAAIALHEHEVELREAARRLELDPTCAEEARSLFALASEARAERLDLLHRCGLT